MNKEILYELAEKYGFNIIEIEPGDGHYLFYKGREITLEEAIEILKDYEV